jgi:IS4 transposase
VENWTRSKESLCFKVIKRLPKGTDNRILSDELVVLKNKDSRANYPEPMRRVRALVEVDGKEREMEFLTNNLQWSAASVAALYRCRWQIEVFFKQIKQSLHSCALEERIHPESGWVPMVCDLIYGGKNRLK